MSNTSNKQKGFTLIELMIVITIIGILASIAVPAYRDYTIRTRVAECATVSAPIKTAIGLYASDTAALPSNLTVLAESRGISPIPADYKGDYVSIMTVGGTGAGNGDITCTLKPGGELGDAASKILRYDASIVGEVLTWEIISVANKVPKKYWPAN